MDGQRPSDDLVKAIVDELHAFVRASSKLAATRIAAPQLKRLASQDSSAALDVDLLCQQLDQVARRSVNPVEFGYLSDFVFGAARWDHPNLAKNGRASWAGTTFELTTKSASWWLDSRKGKPSELQVLLTTLARAIAIEVDKQHTGTSEAPPTDVGRFRTRRPRRRTIGAATTAVGCVAILGIAALVGDGERRSQRAESSSLVSDSPPLCTTPVGGPAEDLGPEDRRLLADHIGRWRQLSGGDCPSELVHSSGAGILQEMGRMGHRTGAVLMAPNGFPLRLNDSQYASLRNLFGNDDISTGVAIEGLPLRIERRASYVEIPLSNGGSMFGESEVGPYFVVPAFAGAFGRYQAEGGPTGRLGLPTSIPFVPVVTTPWHEVGRWILEFEFGYMALAGDGRIQVDFVEDPGLLWHSLPRPSGSIVAQPGGQSWYIDHNRRRHWIPDGATYECLGGRSNAPSELQNLPGYAVWSFELAPVATCALDPGE